MTSGQAASRLSALSGGAIGPAEKGALFQSALGRLQGHGGRPECVLWVPGRLEVFGKHTDYAGGRTIVAAVPRGFAVAAAPRTDGLIHVIDAARGQDVTLRIGHEGAAHEGEGRASRGWRHYVATVAGRLSRNFPGAVRGATISLASDLPRASGMSSSSALMVAVAASLVRIGSVDATAAWRSNIHGPLDAASYFACIENGLPFAGLAGDAGVGTHGGSEDHAAILTGRPGHVSAFGFVPVRRLEEVPVPEGWQFVLTPSGVAADKTGGALGPYNRLARGVRILLDLWNASAAAPASSLAAAVASSADAPERLAALAAASQVPDWSPVQLQTRLRHFIREDARIPLAIDAFRTADTAALGALAADSQQDAEALLLNQVPETVDLAAAARRLGARASSSFGAGFGGSVWALVAATDAGRFAARWHPRAFAGHPGPPLVDLMDPAKSGPDVAGMPGGGAGG